MDAEEGRGLTDRRPIPDPTVLTTQQLQREIQALRDILNTRIDAVQDQLHVRLSAMDKAMEVATAIVTHTPTEIDKQILHLKELHDAKFAAIDRQFENRDSRAEQANRDNKENVAAALNAAKESVKQHNDASALAIAKSEAATNKQIDQIMTLFHTSNGSLEGKIGDIKDRLTLIEGKGAGVTVAQNKQEKDSSFWVSVVAVLVAFGSLIAMVLINLAKNGG